jgi:hypothetical protein
VRGWMSGTRLDASLFHPAQLWIAALSYGFHVHRIRRPDPVADHSFPLVSALKISSFIWIVHVLECLELRFRFVDSFIS